MADYPAQQQLIAALCDPRRYPHAAGRVRLLETHISWVLLAGRYAYKIKKAVNLGFLDFTRLAARRHYCLEELRLNRRLAPQLYLEAIAIGGTPAEPQLGGNGRAIEYAVKMRRFAAGALLDQQLARGRLTPQHIDRLAATLARFHTGLPPAATDTPYGTATGIWADALQNFEQLQTLLPGTDDLRMLQQVRRDSDREYAACERIFEQRRAQGFVRECHGDLHLGNIALRGGEPLPFDGIEFNAGLRWIDVVNDIAFLHMDLLYHQQPALAFRLLNAWLERSGDYAGIAVLRFYCAYRAMVRAKVNAIRAQQAAGRAQAKQLAACRKHLTLAAHCLQQRRPALIITHGLPGSGKTTFAQAALEELQAIRLRSDVERKRMFGLLPQADSRSAPGRGIYDASATANTYARLQELARQLLAAGHPVIVDAAFLKQQERESFRALAAQLQVPFAIASLQATPATLRARIAQRQAQGGDASEANLEVLEKLRQAQQPLDSAELQHTAIFTDTASPPCIDTPGWKSLQALLAHRC
jgi:aminoglycoside phosphotransferase family enzyme/predicted kinase